VVYTEEREARREGGCITRDEWDLKERRHTGIQGQEELIRRSIAMSRNLLSVREVKKTDDWGQDVRQQKAVYVHQNSQGKFLFN